MGTSKILIDGVGIDLTSDTVAANKMLSGTKAHDSNGDSVTGNIASKASATYTPGTADQTIAAGQYLSGAQTIKGDANLIAENIKQGVSIYDVTGSLKSKETVTWHQCSEQVKNFVNYVQANNLYTRANRYDFTVIDSYAPSTRPLTAEEVQDYTKPHGKTIDNVTFYDNEPNLPIPFATGNSAGTLTFADKIRWYNTTYSSVQTGGFYPLGKNYRDLGGWACDGGTVKYGLLIRGGEANPVDKELMVDKIGVKTEVCFLPLNKQQFSNESPWGIDRVINWTNDDFMYRINNTSSIPTVVEQWKLYLTTIIKSINRGKPVVFHCGAGADKTGTMALMLLALLGVSEQDIDIDFELTEFSESLSSFYRTRKMSEYNRLKNEILAFPLQSGLADSFQNRCVSFALSLGITVEELNDFRGNCIAGEPSVLEPSIAEYSISKTASHVIFSNTDVTVPEWQGYITNISAVEGYVITGITITMDGVDITENCFTGEQIPFGTIEISENGETDVSWKELATVNVPAGETASVTKTLGNSTSDNTQESVIVGQSYGEKITANQNFEIDSISVFMDGVDITQDSVTLF